MTVSPSSTGFVSVLLTIAVAFNRVLPPLVPPPSPQLVYDTYIGLTPVVSHFVLFLLFVPLQLALSIIFPSALGLHDRILPLLPVCAAALYTCHGPLSSDRRTAEGWDARLALMSALICVWAAQNLRVAASRGDLGRTVDDFRYARIRTRIGRIPFALVSSLLTAVNTIAAFFTTAPLFYAWTSREPWPGTLTAREAALAAVILLAIVFKEIAVRQVAAYVEESPQSGFMTTGLYAWVRQPEVLAELVVWWGFYGFAVVLGGSFLAWPIVGVISYSLLQIMWVHVTERIVVEEFPKYRSDVQAKVWLLLPTPPRAQISSSDPSGGVKEKKDQ